MIHDLKKQGLSVTSIARKVGCDRKTVRKYLELGLEGRRMARASHAIGCLTRLRGICVNVSLPFPAFPARVC